MSNKLYPWKPKSKASKSLAKAFCLAFNVTPSEISYTKFNRATILNTVSNTYHEAAENRSKHMYLRLKKPPLKTLMDYINQRHFQIICIYYIIALYAIHKGNFHNLKKYIYLIHLYLIVFQ